jgi:hypothetical protein
MDCHTDMLTMMKGLSLYAISVALPYGDWSRQTKAGCGVGQRVNGIQLGDEIPDFGVADGRDETGNVDLRELVRHLPDCSGRGGVTGGGPNGGDYGAANTS